MPVVPDVARSPPPPALSGYAAPGRACRLDGMATPDNGRQPLTPPRALAVELALDGRTYPEIAEALEVRRETAWKWFQRPDVAAELDRQRARRLDLAAEHLAEAAPAAVRYLRELVDDDTAPAHARIRAAFGILDRAGMTPQAARERLEEREDEVDLSADVEAFLRILPAVLHHASMETLEDFRRCVGAVERNG